VHQLRLLQRVRLLLLRPLPQPALQSTSRSPSRRRPNTSRSRRHVRGALPKDKVFRVPPPENARLFQHYTRRADCSCLYLAVAVLSLAAAVGVVYLAFKPRQPAYSVVSLAVSGLAGVSNASAPGPLSPGFAATVRADNSANGKVGVHYDGAGSRVAVSYEGMSLADGAWPAFYQASCNITVFVAKAKGTRIRFSKRERGQMAAAERLPSVPFDVDITVPVRLQLGGVRTWAVPVTVRCAMTVDRLAASAKVVSRPCDVNVPFLFRSGGTDAADARKNG
uniref:Late embryogenesis abundant protein LEA-2 subgroup domain-containing protein n=1 Tax=Triticum urartu TaxID=4572 RepID=A0A8R7TCJ2_TRIUA